MVLILKSIYNYVVEWDRENKDPVYAGKFLLRSPLLVLLIIAVYVGFVFKWGPQFMKNRQPYNLKTVLLVYNAIQIVLNFYVGFRAFYTFVRYTPYDVTCMMPLPDDHHFAHIERNSVYVYVLLKIVDLMDTVFFVLRKNFKQISFLHVYHHITMALATFFICRYNNCGGQAIIMGMLNFIVHGFMYLYYLASALSDRVKRSLWWKKYITIIQMVQFVITITHYSYTLIFRPDCQFSRFVLKMITLESFIMFVLFAKFFIQAYVINGNKNASKKRLKTE